MKPYRVIVLAALALAVAGCSNSTAELYGTSTTSSATAISRNYAVRDVRTTVPPGLRVSEANNFYPITDIVWRGDPIGDRHAQIAAMFETAAGRGAETLRGAVPVIADIEVVRFHGVTERTHYSVGGIYNIIFKMTVRNADTGAIIEPTRQIEADLPAPGGRAAIRLDEEGQTEKVRVTDFLTLVLQEELSGREIPATGAI